MRLREGTCVLLTMLLLVPPLSSIFVSTGEENGALQDPLLRHDSHQGGGRLLLPRSIGSGFFFFNPHLVTTMI